MTSKPPRCPCGNTHVMKANIGRIPYWQCLRADCKRYFIMQEDRLQVCEEIKRNRPDLANVDQPGVSNERIFVFWALTYSWKETAKRILAVLRQEDPLFFERATPASTIDRDFRGRASTKEEAQ